MFDSHPSTRRTASNGFTLVELLVVVGIISALVAILLPALSRARDQAKLVQCLSNIRQIGIGLVMYSSENKGWYPPETTAWFVTVPSYGFNSDARHLTSYLYGDLFTNPALRPGRYISSKSVFYCPSDFTHGETSFETVSLFGLAGEGNWPTCISYNYFEDPDNRSVTWDFIPSVAEEYSPTLRTAMRKADLIILYDNAARWTNNTPIFVHHPRGATGPINYNSTGGSYTNVLCFDGSAHSIFTSYQYWLGTTIPAKLP